MTDQLKTLSIHLFVFAAGAAFGIAFMAIRHEGRQQQFRAVLESNYNARLDDLSKRVSDLKLGERRGK